MSEKTESAQTTSADSKTEATGDNSERILSRKVARILTREEAEATQAAAGERTGTNPKDADQIE